MSYMARKEWVGLGLIILLAAALRFWGINHDIWTDENKAVNPSIDMVKDGQFPLLVEPQSRYPHLSHYIFSVVFWPLTLLYSEAPYELFQLVARITGAVLNVGVVLMVFLVGRRLFGVPSALLAAAFMAVMPLHVKYSHYAHVEIPGVLIMMFAIWTALNIWENGRARWYAVTGLLIGMAVATQFWALAIGAALLLAHGGHVAKNGWALSTAFRPAFFASLFLIPLGFFLVSPWAVLHYQQNFPAYQQLSLRGAAGDLGHTRPHVLWPLYNWSQDWSVSFTSSGLFWETPALVFSLAVVGAIFAYRRRNWELFVMIAVLSVILFLAISGAMRLYAVKRLLPLGPLLALLAGYGGMELRQRWPRLTWVLVIVIFASTLWSVGAFDGAYAGGSTHARAVTWAESNIPDGAVVLQSAALRLLEWGDSRRTVVRFEQVYASFTADDPEAAHDRAKPLSEWLKEGVDYVVLDSRLVDRYSDATSIKLYPETTASYQAFYNEVRQRGKLVYEIHPEPWVQAGARVEIYDVRGLE